MYPFVFSSCDFVQIKLTVGQNTYFFKTAGSLTNRKIKSISIPSLSYSADDLSSIDPAVVYITLIDKDGNIIHNNTPVLYFSSASLDLIRIDRVIDWERSYIKIIDTPDFDLNELSFFMNVYSDDQTDEAAALLPLKENYFSVTIKNTNPDGVGYFTMTFDKILNALRGKKITGILLNVIPSYVVGFITLYPLDQTRVLNRIDISNFLFFAPKSFYGNSQNPELLRYYDRRCVRKYITPVQIDFEKSNIEVVSVESFNLTFIYE